MGKFEHIIDLIVAVIVILIFPLIYFGLKQDSLMTTAVDTETRLFVDDIRSKGFVTKAMYNDYSETLAETGLLYDINLEHKHINYEPEYRLRTVEEVINEQNGAYTGANTYHYYPVTTEIQTVIDPIHEGSINTETNDSILSSSVNTPPDSNHKHTKECYAGHRHTGDKTFIHTHKHNSNCRWYLTSKYFEYDCNSCGYHNNVCMATYYYDPEKGGFVCAYANNGFRVHCINCENTSYSNFKVVDNHAYSCGYSRDFDGDGFYDQVDRENTFEYIMDYPQDNRFSQTYTRGCYQYHVPGEIKNIVNPFDELRWMGVHSFCKIPEIYQVVYSYDTWYYWVNYRAVMDENKQIRLIYMGCNHEYANPEYPRELTFIEAYQNMSGNFKNFLSKKGHVFVPELGSVYTETYGTIDICGNNHAKLNRWYTICGMEEDNTLSCNQLIESIQPTHPVQTVYTGESLITTAVATYRDGSTKMIECNTDFITNHIVKNKVVTLTYQYTVGSHLYTLSCNIDITVIPRNKTCINGHTYNLNLDGTDPGCPYCHAWLRSLIVCSPPDGSLTIYRGTTLEENGVTLLATYLDGRTEFVESGYVDNLDRYYIGSQNVTISYKGKYVNLTVINKRNIKLCSVCGRYYELYPDNSDPGCPYCQAETPIFTGNVMEYKDIKYASDILRELYEGSGTYYFNTKDYLNITVKATSKSRGRKLVGSIYRNFDESYLAVKSGGYIREDGQ